jgi:hypothetical protein
MQNIAYSTFGLESAILEEVTDYESVTDSERGEFPRQKAPRRDAGAKSTYWHENDPPERVIGLALASILFQKICSGFFQGLGDSRRV